MPHKGRHSAFTLIELLVVIAILAILAVVVVLVLNPAELLKQSRDANRLSDMQTLNSALGLYNTDQSGASSFSLGSSSVLYVSVPDPMATSSLGDQCQGLGLPALPTGWTYQCTASSTLHATNGTGWIPVDLKAISAGSPVGSLPVDPVNTTTTGQYYAYSTDGIRYELTALPESQKQRTIFQGTPPVADYPGIVAMGTSLALSPLYNPGGLNGYWNFNEGTGTVTMDASGNGNTGTLINGPTWTTGKIGGGLSFNGTNQYVNVPDAASLDLAGPWTVSAWVDLPTLPTSGNAYPVISKRGTAYTTGTDYWLGVSNNNLYVSTLGWSVYYMSSGWAAGALGSMQINTGSWYLVTGVYNSYTAYLYLNGQLVGTDNNNAAWPDPGPGDPLYLGRWDMYNGSTIYLQGTISDVRLYDRALSPAEIFALYNAER